MYPTDRQWHVDRSDHTFIPMCKCGWRGLPELEYERALRVIVRHYSTAHPDNPAPAKQLARRKRDTPTNPDNVTTSTED